MSDLPPPQGEIYDLGYRRYHGERLGRRAAVRALTELSVRNVFGLGRGTLPKVLAFSLTLLAFSSALVTLILAAMGASEFQLVGHDEHFGRIQQFLVLFVAAMSSELVGSDRKNNLLPLYFSRPIARDDYVLAKIGALFLALLALTLGPQLMMFVANWLGAADSTEWLGDNGTTLLRILAGSGIAALHLATIGVAIAMFSSRRAFALISVLGVLLVAAIAAAIIATLVGPTAAGVALLCSPLAVMFATQLYIFGSIPPVSEGQQQGNFEHLLAYTELPHWTWLLATVAQISLAAALAVGHYRRSL